jgi:hypothetical protein
MDASGEDEPVNDAAQVIVLPSAAARLLAVEMLLADPEALANDALEGDLYILRDKLLGVESEDE